MPLFYKYLPCDRSSYVKDQLLRFTQPSDLNDPFECLPHVIASNVRNFVEKVAMHPEPSIFPSTDSKSELRRKNKLIKKISREKAKEFTENPVLLSEMFFNFYLRRLNNQIGIFSLSKKWNSTLMWSHYTNHHGFCIGFEREHNFFLRRTDEPKDIGIPIDVKYSKERPKVDLTNHTSLPENIFEQKHEDWRYEDEVRMIRLLHHANQKIERPDPLLPIYLFIVPHTAIREIIIGINCAGELKDKLVDLSRKLSVPAYQAELSLTAYDLQRRPLFLPIQVR